jgi:hypothetical protein
MRSTFKTSVSTLLASLALVALSACSSMPGMSGMMGMDGGLKLTGDQEVPPVATAATGIVKITVASDGGVSGTITTDGIAGTMAHIHAAALGVNGPVIIPLVKTSDNVWSVPPGAKLTDAQLASYKAGDLYVNVHSAEHKGGEIRTQLKP